MRLMCASAARWNVRLYPSSHKSKFFRKAKAGDGRCRLSVVSGSVIRGYGGLRLAIDRTTRSMMSGGWKYVWPANRKS
jgi:hypothetical protein